MSKKIFSLIFIIAVFIPSFVAIGYYSSKKSEPANANDITALKIIDLNDAEWSFTLDESDTANEVIDMFVTMRKNATQEQSLPAAMQSKTPFNVTMTSYGTDYVYEYYFTDSANQAYFEDSVGNAFKIADADAEKFLSSTYAMSIFTDGKLPMLVVGGENGKAVAPGTATWSYFGYNNVEKRLDTSSLTSETETCNIIGGLDLSFTDAPDYVYLNVKNGENSLFEGTIDTISTLTLDDIDEISVEVKAQWFLSNSVTNEAIYRFTGNIVAPATFYLGQTTVRNGGFVVIGGKNVTHPGEIQFSSSPELNYEPVFYQEGSFVYALVPISYDLEDGTDKTFTFTVSYGGVTQNMSLSVTSYEYKAATSKITKAVEEATYNAAAQGEAEEALHELAKRELLAEHSFDGVFIKDVVGEDSESCISPGFGRIVTISETGTQFRHTGCDYNVPAGTEVLAVNKGQVVYSGYLTMTGYIVVIDHGWGLKSWYCHLSECSVKEGDVVEKGALVGLSGDTGFAAKNRTHVGLTVGDIPVSIYDLWETPIAIPEMAE